MAVTVGEFVGALIVSAVVGLAHWLAHSYFGDPGTFQQAGVMEAGVIVFLGVFAVVVLTDDD